MISTAQKKLQDNKIVLAEYEEKIDMINRRFNDDADLILSDAKARMSMLRDCRDEQLAAALRDLLMSIVI